MSWDIPPDYDELEDNVCGGAPPTCKYCNKKNLQWEETKWGFRLFDNGVAHKCDQRARSPREIAKRTKAIDVIESRLYDSSEATDLDDALYGLIEKAIGQKSVFQVLEALNGISKRT